MEKIRHFIVLLHVILEKFRQNLFKKIKQLRKAFNSMKVIDYVQIIV